MRRLLALLLLVSCAPDLSDFSEDDGPRVDKVKRCNEMAHHTPDGLYNNDIYLACMYGTVEKPDGGTSD